MKKQLMITEKDLFYGYFLENSPKSHHCNNVLQLQRGEYNSTSYEKNPLVIERLFKFYREAFKRDSHDCEFREFYLYRGKIREADGNPEEALKDYKLSVDSFERTFGGRGFYAEARVLFSLNRIEEAFAALWKSGWGELNKNELRFKDPQKIIEWLIGDYKYLLKETDPLNGYDVEAICSGFTETIEAGWTFPLQETSAT